MPKLRPKRMKMKVARVDEHVKKWNSNSIKY